MVLQESVKPVLQTSPGEEITSTPDDRRALSEKGLEPPLGVDVTGRDDPSFSIREIQHGHVTGVSGIDRDHQITRLSVLGERLTHRILDLKQRFDRITLRAEEIGRQRAELCAGQTE